MHRTAILATAILVFSAQSSAQETRPKCPATELHRYDFLVGNWHGREYTFAHGPGDSTFEALWTAHIRKLPFECAFEEDWDIIVNGKMFNQVAIMRGYDIASHQWMYSLTDYFVEFAIFGSTPGDSSWVYSHDIPGRPVRLKTMWVKTPAGYTEVMQVSSDSGRTWPIYRHVNYTRDRG